MDPKAIYLYRTWLTLEALDWERYEGAAPLWLDAAYCLDNPADIC